ncbi:MAG: type II toxin-antitoxin system VapB family antitoxin [Myxococcota bacterium]
MGRARTKVFLSNKTQAVRLPKSVALPDDVIEVEIVAQGDVRVVIPASQTWSTWFDSTGVSEDFGENRSQEADRERDPL